MLRANRQHPGKPKKTLSLFRQFIGHFWSVSDIVKDIVAFPLPAIFSVATKHRFVRQNFSGFIIFEIVQLTSRDVSRVDRNNWKYNCGAISSRNMIWDESVRDGEEETSGEDRGRSQ